jgi:hypothetical protein
MAYKISWLLENRIMLITYDGLLSKADLQNYLSETMDMRDRANAKLGIGGPLVHTITDARRMTKSEMSLKEALNMLTMVRKQRVGWSLYIPANRLDKFFASLGHQLVGVRFNSFESVNDAIRFLIDTDESLGDFSYDGDDTVELKPVETSKSAQQH